MMKRMIYMVLILAVAFAAVACGEKETEQQSVTEDKGCEIAVIAEYQGAGAGTFSAAAWKRVNSFASENGIQAAKYEPEEASKEGYAASVKKASEDGAKLIVLPGKCFETAAYQVQSEYPDVDFLLLDGVPHDADDKYATSKNTIGIIFAEEEAGYLAGYGAVKEGYTKLGFLGEQELPAIKRYGYGFVQGAAAAAAENEIKTEISYRYMKKDDKADDAGSVAAEWYKSGTEVIFSCGGGYTEKVAEAADTEGGKVIGSDTDQSSLSENVITSAKKGVGSAVETVLKSYRSDRFDGGTAFNYTAKNNGVMLEMKNARFQHFTGDDYKKILKQLKEGNTELKKDADVESVSELTGKWVKIKEQ